MNMKNIHIGLRLAAGFAAVVGLFLLALLLIGKACFEVTQNVREIKEEALPFALIVDQMDTDRSEVQQFLTDVSATHNRDGYKDAEDSAKKFLQGAAKFKQLFQSESETEQLKKMERIEADFNAFYVTGKHMAEVYVTQGVDAGNKIMEDFDKESEALATGLAKFREEQIDEANQRTSDTLAAAEMAKKEIIWSALIAVLLAVVLSVLITRSVTLPMNRMRSEIVSIGQQGDFGSRVSVASRDEVGQTAVAFNELMANLQSTFRQLQDNIESIHGAAQAMRSLAHQVSGSSEQQSNATVAIATTVNQVTASVNHISENANNALNLSRESGDLSSQGGDIIHNTASEMQKIADTVRQASQSIEALGQQSAHISTIVQVIKEIADQTNLLALNAAIEAARAGEQGRGFAVVADEVRKLAERTAQATMEITEKIGSIQNTSQTAVTSMSSAAGQVDIGVDLAQQAGMAINQIKAKSVQVLDTSNGISAALEGQILASNEIAAHIEKVAHMTRENSTATQQASEAANHLTELAEAMRMAINRFKV